MSAISGKVGSWQLEFKSAPRGAEGQVEVCVAGSAGAAAGAASAVTTVTVRWRSDEHGIWVETPEELAGYDMEGELDEDGKLSYRLLRRGSAGEHAGLSYARAGEAEAASAQGAKKAVRVRSQMPGKIIRVQVKPGDAVQKGDPLLVMEAMKMENEIRAVHAGVVKSVQVSAGQAVETGADLILMEGA